MPPDGDSFGISTGPTSPPNALSNPITNIDEGVIPATIGILRLSTGAKRIIAWRDAVNTLDEHVLDIDAGGSVYLGTGSAFTTADQAPGVCVFANFTVAIGIGSSTYLYCYNGNVEHYRPCIGSTSGSSPWGATDGLAPIVVAAANITLSATQYSTRIQKFTGAPAATRTITYPLPANDGESYERTVWCQTTVSGLTISVGTGTTVLLTANDAPHHLIFTPTGVVRVLT